MYSRRVAAAGIPWIGGMRKYSIYRALYFTYIRGGKTSAKRIVTVSSYVFLSSGGERDEGTG